MDERHRRARELLESSGTLLLFKERQLIKENRFPEVVVILRTRLRRVRTFVLITAVLVVGLIGSLLFADANRSWIDLLTIIGFLAMIVTAEYNNRKLDSALSEVDSMFEATGSDDAQALS